MSVEDVVQKELPKTRGACDIPAFGHSLDLYARVRARYEEFRRVNDVAEIGCIDDIHLMTTVALRTIALEKARCKLRRMGFRIGPLLPGGSEVDNSCDMSTRYVWANVDPTLSPDSLLESFVNLLTLRGLFGKLTSKFFAEDMTATTVLIVRPRAFISICRSVSYHMAFQRCSELIVHAVNGVFGVITHHAGLESSPGGYILTCSEEQVYRLGFNPDPVHYSGVIGVYGILEPDTKPASSPHGSVSSTIDEFRHAYAEHLKQVSILN